MSRRSISCAVLLASTLVAEARPTTATVGETRSRWASPELIVTDVEILDADGRREITVLGGTVDGIGMTFSHHEIPTRGDRVAAGGATARFGVKRTTSGTPVWRSSCVRFVSDATPMADVPNVDALLDRAFAAWATDGTPLVVERTTGDVETALDGKSVIVFRQERWCRPAIGDAEEICYSPEAAATTRTLFVDKPGDPEDGRIIETDIEINAVDFAFFHDGTSLETSGEPADFLSVVTHELGHAFGLAHNCAIGDEPPARDVDGAEVPRCEDVAQDPAYTLATMYPTIGRGETHKESLAASDLAGARTTLRPSETCEAAYTAGCSAGSGSAGIGLVLALLLARRRGALAWLAATGCAGVAPTAADRDGDAAPTAVLEGLAVDYFTGDPRAAIVLETRGFEPERRVISDRDGTYRLDGLPARETFQLISAPDELNVATATTHRLEDDAFAEAAVIAWSDLERQAAVLERVLEGDAGVVVAEIVRGDAAAVGLSLANVALVETTRGRIVDAPKVWFGAGGDVDPRIVTSLATRGAARLAIVGVPAGTYTLTVTDRDTVTSTTLELPAGGAAVAKLALP